MSSDLKFKWDLNQPIWGSDYQSGYRPAQNPNRSHRRGNNNTHHYHQQPARAEPIVIQQPQMQQYAPVIPSQYYGQQQPVVMNTGNQQNSPLSKILGFVAFVMILGVVIYFLSQNPEIVDKLVDAINALITKITAGIQETTI